MLARSPLVSAINMVAAEPGGEELIAPIGEVPRPAGDAQRLGDAPRGGLPGSRHVLAHGLSQDPGLRDPARPRQLLHRAEEGLVQVDGRLLLLAPEWSRLAPGRFR